MQCHVEQANRYPHGKRCGDEAQPTSCQFVVGIEDVVRPSVDGIIDFPIVSALEQEGIDLFHARHGLHDVPERDGVAHRAVESIEPFRFC